MAVGSDNRHTQRVLVEVPAEIVSEINDNSAVLHDWVKRVYPRVQFSAQAARDAIEAVYAYCLLFKIGWK